MCKLFILRYSYNSRSNPKSLSALVLCSPFSVLDIAAKHPVSSRTPLSRETPLTEITYEKSSSGSSSQEPCHLLLRDTAQRSQPSGKRSPLGRGFQIRDGGGDGGSGVLWRGRSDGRGRGVDGGRGGRDRGVTAVAVAVVGAVAGNGRRVRRRRRGRGGRCDHRGDHCCGGSGGRHGCCCCWGKVPLGYLNVTSLFVSIFFDEKGRKESGFILTFACI